MQTLGFVGTGAKVWLQNSVTKDALDSDNSPMSSGAENRRYFSCCADMYVNKSIVNIIAMLIIAILFIFHILSKNNEVLVNLNYNFIPRFYHRVLFQ